MAEIDLDPNFKYLQANQQRALQGIQMGLEIAGRNQMMEMRRQEFAQQLAQDRIRSNLMAAQANRYNQMAADGLIESELEAAEAEPMQKWVSSFYAAANDPTGKTPFAPPPNVKSRNNVATVQRLTVEAGKLGPLARFNDQQQNLFRQQIEMQAKEMENLYDLQKYSSVPIYTIDQKDPKGYTVNEPALQQAMANRSKATQMKAISGPTDVALMSDAELAQMASIPLESVPTLRNQIAGNKDISVTKMPMAVQYVSQLKSAGLPMSKEEEAYVIGQYISPGVTMNAPARTLTEITGESSNLKMLDDALSKIDAFNKKYQAEYGADAFQQFVGPIDRGVNEQAAKRLPERLRPTAISDANNVFETVAKIIGGYRRERFGTALSQGETQAFRQEIRDNTFSDYTRSIRNFRNNMLSEIQEKLGYYKFAPNIPLPIKQRFFATPQSQIETYSREFQSPQPSSEGTTNRVRIKLEDL